MRKIFLMIALLGLAMPAHAADMPLKAPAANNLTVFPYNTSGIYWGFATKVAVEQSNVSSGGNPLFATSLATGNLNAAGGGVGGTVGYMKGFGDKWMAFETSLYYQNITASAPAVSASGASVNASVASRWSAEQVIKIGGFNPLSYLSNLGFQFPTLPTQPTVPGITLLAGGHPYLMVGAEEFGITGTFFTAGGTTWGIAPLVGAGILNQIVDSTGKLTGGVLDTGAQVVFGDKGAQISGLFSTPSTPAAFGANASMGTKYEAFAKLDF